MNKVVKQIEELQSFIDKDGLTHDVLRRAKNEIVRLEKQNTSNPVVDKTNAGEPAF